MGSDFMSQFQAGWQMGMQKNQNARQDQIVQQRLQQEEQDRMLRQKLLDFKIKEAKVNAERARTEDEIQRALLAQKLAAETDLAQAPQEMMPPTEMGGGVGPDGLPIAPEGMPSSLSLGTQPQRQLTVGGLPVPVPLRYKQEIDAEKQAEEQRKIRVALGLEAGKVTARETAQQPFEIAAEERANKAREEQFNRQDARIAAREKEREDKQMFAQGNRLRSEYNRESKKLRDGLNDMQRFVAPVESRLAEGKAPTAADQFALIYAFNKALDPSSVVRESEFRNTQSVGAGVTQRAFLALKKLRSGEQLAPEQITQMLDTIRRARAATEDSLGAIQSRYGELAASYGVDPSIVISAPVRPPAEAPGGNDDPLGLLGSAPGAADDPLGLLGGM